MATLINPLYTSAGVLAEIKEAFLQKGMIRLPNFLVESDYLALKPRPGNFVRVPDKHAYFESDIDFNSKEFSIFMSTILGTKNKIQLDSRIYGHKCYTLLHDDNSSSGVEFFFDIVGNWKHDYGGAKIYSANEPLIFEPQGNCLSIINAKNKQGFVKYVNHKAGKNFIARVEGIV